MKNLGLFITILLSLFLSACASVSQMQTELANSAQTTSSIEDITFNPIVEDKVLSVQLDSKSPSFMFDNGKNYYAAYRLEHSGKPRYLNIKTYLTSIYLPTASVYVPEVTALDSQKKFINTIKLTRLDDDSDFWKGGFYQGKIPLPENTAFIIIHKTDTFSGELVAYSENGTPFVLPLAPAGKLELSLGKPLPSDYDFSMVTIKDSAIEHGDHKADFFFVSKIDEKDVKNSLMRTTILNRGRGLSMQTYLIDREVPANKPVSLTIVGRTHHAAPILALTGEEYEVKGKINFAPQKNAKYVVKGILSKTSSSVWVENEETQEIMDKKIESKGNSELGFFEK